MVTRSNPHKHSCPVTSTKKHDMSPYCSHGVIEENCGTNEKKREKKRRQTNESGKLVCHMYESHITSVQKTTVDILAKNTMLLLPFRDQTKLL